MRPPGCTVRAGGGPEAVSGAAAAGRIAGGEGVDHLTVVAQRQVKMRDFGIARKADLAQGRACGDNLTIGHADGALFEVTILSFPAVFMGDDDSIATVAVGDIRRIRGIGGDIGDAVTGGADAARCRREDGYAFCHCREGGQGKITAFVPIIAQSATGEIGGFGAWNAVGELLDEAGFIQRTIQREGQEKRPLLAQGPKAR